MLPGERLKNWIDSLAQSWKDRLRGWMVSWTAKGITVALESMEPGAIDAYRDALTKLRDNPYLPPEMKAFYDKALIPGNPFSVFAGVVTGVLGILGALMGGSVPFGNLLRYDQDRLLKSSRLDPAEAITAWRRDKGKYADVFDDLRDQGWDNSRIEALKFITEVIPGVSDLIRMSVREAFSPEIAERFGQYQDPPVAVYPWAEKVGLSKEWVDRYWAAHWELPSPLQGFEMLRRGIIDEDTLKLLLRALDVMPFWRDKLINISWEVPTRVDVRRFWDMRVIDEARLRQIYTAQGYHDKDLEDYVTWTKVFVDFPTLLARWKNGWITLDQVRQRLIELGMPADRAEEMLQEKVQAEGASRTTAERDLTQTDIYKGVKQERLTRLEGLEMLMDLGYDENEASYKLDINVPSDETVSAVERRQLTKADVLRGLKAGIITEAGARAILLDLRYSAADVEFLLKLYRATVNPPAEPRLKEASKADILLGVKRGIITPEEGFGMLLDIGFSPEAADFILMVKAEESPFSPVTYAEFKDRTQRWRLSAGLEGKPVSEELKKAGALVIKVTAEVEALRRSVKEEQGRLIPDEALPETATARLTELQVALHRAEAELQRVRTDYDAKLAEWKYGLR